MDESLGANGNSLDPSTISEEEFELHTTYIVPDLPVDRDTPNRAEATLPRNLVLKPSNALSDVSVHDNNYLQCFHLTLGVLLGPRSVEHRVYPTRNKIWPPRGRNLRQRRCALLSESKILLEGKYIFVANFFLL